MVYLGIKEADNCKDNGVYFFDVLSVRDEIASHFTNPILYSESEKDKMLEDFGIEEKDIQNGIVLIRKFRYGRQEGTKCYLGVRGTPFDGVYEFERVFARDKIANKFTDTYKSTDLEAILKEFKVDKSEVKNGGFLYSKEVSEFLKKQKKEIKAQLEGRTENITEQKNVGNTFKSMLNVFAADKDVIEVIMNEGTVYRITVRPIFFLRNGVSLSNCASLDTDEKVVIDSAKVDKLVEDNDILVVNASKIGYHNDYVVIYNCDDIGSPVVKVEKGEIKGICHLYDKVVINPCAVSSIVGEDTYKELAIDYSKLTQRNNKHIYEYLLKKWGF